MVLIHFQAGGRNNRSNEEDSSKSDDDSSSDRDDSSDDNDKSEEGKEGVTHPSGSTRAGWLQVLLWLEHSFFSFMPPLPADGCS